MDEDELGRFPSSEWSLVERLRAGPPAARREALDALIVSYLPPLRAHLVLRMRLDRSRTEDLLHDFIQDKILERDLLGQADPAKGQMRSLLLRSLENYVIDRMRKESRDAAKGVGDLDPDAAFPIAADEPPDEFEIVWARQVLNLTLERMRSECAATDRLPIWRIFEFRVLRPALMGTAPPGYERFARQFGFSGPEQASNALMTAKRQFSRVLRSVVGEYRPANEVDDELADLRGALARLGPLGITIPADVAGDEFAATLAAGDDVAESQAGDLEIISRMLAVRDERDELWDAADLGELLRDLLSVPVADLTPGFTASESTALVDLFERSNSNIAILEAAKKRARESIGDDASALPRDVWSVIYFASIAAGLVHHRQRISKSNDEMLAYGFGCILELPWVSDPLRRLFREAVGRVAGPASDESDADRSV